jgi:phenylacetate-CoA ligase
MASGDARMKSFTNQRRPAMLDHPRSAHFTEALGAFIATPLDRLLEPLPASDPAQGALALFHRVVAEVPAYRAFLADNGVDPGAIATPADFARLPLVNKANYIQRYPLAERCRHGRLESCDMIAVSSGSTGEPTFWPRFLADELAIAQRFEQIFHDSFAADGKRTLAVICFAMGSWVGGLFTLACCRWLAAKGYPITAVAPGNDKREIWRVVQALAQGFEQTVLLGYPPFLKDVIDGGAAAGIDWPTLSVRLVLAGEVFSEEWRTLVGGRLGGTQPLYESASLYGTADAGVLGNETPLSIAIRRFLAREPDIARALFGESRLPTLVQYDPRTRYFETVDGTLLFTGDNGVPLIRYHIADRGGLVPYDDMIHFLAERGYDPHGELAGQGWRGMRKLPFAYVFGRADFTVSYFGANIFPENVTVGLEQPAVAPSVTGKFVLQAVEGLAEQPHLAIAVELAAGVAPTAALEEAIAQSIVDALLRLNSEFAHYVPAERRRPKMTLAPAGDPACFPVGVKHRYIRR